VALKFFAAELEFLFLDFGQAFAHGGVAVAEEHGADLLEGFHVFGAMSAGEREFEGGLFQHVDGSFRELGLAGDGELEDLSGGFVASGESSRKSLGAARLAKRSIVLLEMVRLNFSDASLAVLR
jgi:hypothetical protein